MQPTHTLLYWKTRSVGGVGWKVYWNETRGRKLLDSLLSSKETSLSHWRTLRAIPQHIVMSMQFHSCLWWRNAASPKGITWLLECMEPWRWVTWLVRWSSARKFLSWSTHIYTITAALKGGKWGEELLENQWCVCSLSLLAGLTLDHEASWGPTRCLEFGDWLKFYCTRVCGCVFTLESVVLSSFILS